MQSFALDQIWWLVSPQNPLKPAQPPYEQRAQSVRALGLSRGMKISRLEHDLGTQFTVDLVKGAKARHPHHWFVFLMGADNFAQLPRWRDWQTIMATLPIGIIARPLSGGRPDMRARLGQAARQYRHARIDEAASHTLAGRTAPAWCYLTSPHNALSSSAIRRHKSLDAGVAKAK